MSMLSAAVQAQQGLRSKRCRMQIWQDHLQAPQPRPLTPAQQLPTKAVQVHSAHAGAIVSR